MMNQTFPLHKLLLILLISILCVVAAQSLDQKHQQNMQSEPQLIFDEFFH